MILGYDVGNPDEVSPEHHADFAEKYQNKVEAQIDALNLGYHSAFIRAKQEIEKLKTERTDLAGRSFTAQ